MGELIWEGDSAGWHVRWTTADISAERGAAHFSWAARTHADFEHELAEQRADDARSAAEDRANGEAPAPPNPCVWTENARLLSLVSGLLSYVATRSTSCEMEAHPGADTKFVTLDLAKDAQPVALDALFPEAAIVSALRADKLIRRALGNASQHMTSLAQLHEALESGPTVLESDLCYGVPTDVLSSFAFHHVESGRVAVRIGLPGTGVCRDNLTQLGVMLPVPATLRDALSHAQTRAEGLLMPDAEAAAHGREAVVSLDGHKVP